MDSNLAAGKSSDSGSGDSFHRIEWSKVWNLCQKLEGSRRMVFRKRVSIVWELTHQLEVYPSLGLIALSGGTKFSYTNSSVRNRSNVPREGAFVKKIITAIAVPAVTVLTVRRLSELSGLAKLTAMWVKEHAMARIVEGP